jgi:hypothetical protein
MRENSTSAPVPFNQDKGFSIVLGGPFFNLLRKAHLTGNDLELLKKRIVIISLLTWLPLLILSMLAGNAWSGAVELPFIKDIEVHVRFLVALPVMIAAELMVHERLRLVVGMFERNNLIPQDKVNQFRETIASAFRWRNSYVAEFLMVVIIYVIGYNVVWQKSMAVETTAWFTDPAAGKGNLSLAGIWFRYVSLPVFQFLFLRWYYRIFIWVRFLFQISAIKFRLSPVHPDHVGGLGFISNIVFAFMPLAFMHGVVLAGMIANHIFHEGTTLLDYKIEIIVIVAVILLLVIVPLFVFSSQLTEAKRNGILHYGLLATQYGQEFEAKWIHHSVAKSGELLGSADIRSLADLQQAFSVVRNMNMVPIARSDIFMLVAATIAPVAPLLLTMMPLSDIIKLVAGMLF